MTTRTALLLLAACGAASLLTDPARAQRVSPMPAGRFMQFCSTPRNGGQPICDAYITGMADSFALMQKLPGGQNQAQIQAGICVPRTASGAAMRNIVVSWIAGHQDRLRNQVGEVVYQALHDSYPCNGSANGQ